jgi:hypothetical protein
MCTLDTGMQGIALQKIREWKSSEKKALRIICDEVTGERINYITRNIMICGVELVVWNERKTDHTLNGWTYRNVLWFISGILTKFGNDIKFLLWQLTQEQKQNCLLVASDLLECSETNDIFLNNITCNKTWICSYNSKTKQQLKSPSLLWLTKVHQVCSKIKAILIIFFNYNDVAYHEYALKGQTINQHFCL